LLPDQREAIVARLWGGLTPRSGSRLPPGVRCPPPTVGFEAGGSRPCGKGSVCDVPENDPRSGVWTSSRGSGPNADRPRPGRGYYSVPAGPSARTPRGGGSSPVAGLLGGEHGSRQAFLPASVGKEARDTGRDSPFTVVVPVIVSLTRAGRRRKIAPGSDPEQYRAACSARSTPIRRRHPPVFVPPGIALSRH